MLIFRVQNGRRFLKPNLTPIYLSKKVSNILSIDLSVVHTCLFFLKLTTSLTVPPRYIEAIPFLIIFILNSCF